MSQKPTTKGYALLAAIITINIFIILSFKARSMWETEIQRDLEEELLFRARQYVAAIEAYKTKNGGVSPQNLDELVEKKFLRKRFKDPMTTKGNWNVVMQEGQAEKKGLLIVPEELLAQHLSHAILLGVSSTCPDEGFMEYRKKKRYYEWAVFSGEDVKKEMPELIFLDQPGIPVPTENSGENSPGKENGNNPGVDDEGHPTDGHQAEDDFNGR